MNKNERQVLNRQDLPHKGLISGVNRKQVLSRHCAYLKLRNIGAFACLRENVYFLKSFITDLILFYPYFPYGISGSKHMFRVSSSQPCKRILHGQQFN